MYLIWRTHVIEHQLCNSQCKNICGGRSVGFVQKPRGDGIKSLLYFVFYILYFCVLYFVFLCFIFCIFEFCVLYFVFLCFIFCILYFCVIIMFLDVGLYRHLVIQIVIFNNTESSFRACNRLYTHGLKTFLLSK